MSLLTPVTKEDREAINKLFEKRRTAMWQSRELSKLAKAESATIQDIAYALRENLGNLTMAARFLGMKRRVLKFRIEETPALRRLLEDIMEENLDVAEYNLMSQAHEGVLPAIITVLKTLGKHRGYSEKATMEYELGPETTRNAAALIEAMRRGGETAKEIEVKDYTWEEPKLELESRS